MRNSAAKNVFPGWIFVDFPFSLNRLVCGMRLTCRWTGRSAATISTS